MAKLRPIIFVEDDLDDQEFIRDIIKKMGIKNELMFFNNARTAHEFLCRKDVQPFIIISDMNLPGATGLDLKQQIDTDPYLRAKSIPFVFLSTSINKIAVDTAYKHLTVQGFFEKPSNLVELEQTIRLIFDYWKLCRHPNSE